MKVCLHSIWRTLTRNSESLFINYIQFDEFLSKIVCLFRFSLTTWIFFFDNFFFVFLGWSVQSLRTSKRPGLQIGILDMFRSWMSQSRGWTSNWSRGQESLRWTWSSRTYNWTYNYRKSKSCHRIVQLEHRRWT